MKTINKPKSNKGIKYFIASIVLTCGWINLTAQSVPVMRQNIITNTTNIAALQAGTNDNSGDIATNAANIATNSTDIATNVTDIATNATDIATNAAAIAADNDGDATNEFNNSAGLNGTALEIVDGGGTLSVDLSQFGNSLLIQDADEDTRVHVEESTDEDIIRFDLGGTEKWVMKGSRLASMNSGKSVFVGEDAGVNDDLTDNRNVFIGYASGFHNQSGSENMFIGWHSGYDNVSGTRNSFLGHLSGAENTTGTNNAFYGYKAGNGNTIGSANTFIGNTASIHNTSGSYNTNVGEDVADKNVSGWFNTNMGYRAGWDNVSGFYNSALGTHAGFNGTNWSNRTALGFNAQNTASNQVRLGNSAVTSIGGYANWSNVSDERMKKNVSEEVIGLEFIMDLRPVTYNLDMDAIAEHLNTDPEMRLYEAEALKANQLQTGFIAQEVAEAAEELGYEFSGVDMPKNDDDMYGLRYAEFVVPLVKGMQEQQVEIVEINEAQLEENAQNQEQQAEIIQLREEIQQLKDAFASLQNETGDANLNTNSGISTGIDFNTDSEIGLDQNKPNPFSEETVIGYAIPQDMNSAQILIFNMNGTQISNIEIRESGKGQVVINANELEAGMYIYSLIVDGKEFDTKRMILTK